VKDKSIIQAKIYELKQLRHDNAIKVDKAKKKRRKERRNWGSNLQVDNDEWNISMLGN